MVQMQVSETPKSVYQNKYLFLALILTDASLIFEFHFFLSNPSNSDILNTYTLAMNRITIQYVILYQILRTLKPTARAPAGSLADDEPR